MKIVSDFSQKEIELLKLINIEIEEKDYTNEEINELYENIYKNGYKDFSISYENAEKYRKVLERLKIFSKIDINKLNKYTKEEFEKDFYVSTVLMHGVVWNNPKRINENRKNEGKDLLTQEEYEKIKEKNKINAKKFEEYMEYLKQKYGDDLDIVNKYYDMKDMYKPRINSAFTIPQNTQP